MTLQFLTLRTTVLDGSPTRVQNWIIVDVDSLLTDWQFKFYGKYKDGFHLHNFGTLTAEPARFINSSAWVQKPKRPGNEAIPLTL